LARSRHGRSRPIGLFDELVQRLFEQSEPRGIGVAELDLHLGPAGDDRGRVWFDQHAADRPHCARAGDLREALVDPCRQPHHRDTGIPAPHHARSAGMVLLAVQSDAIVPNADDRLDHADAQPAGVEGVALLDMGFEIPGP